ncbi:MAG: B12-binding domain-containing protein [Nitrospira sp.]|nr:MAG: B12-binding domain-containing protein [Nitrospira sp.]
MTAPRVLLLIPPLTQLNTPYPSTAYLTGFLQSHGIACEQADLGIEMVLRLFSRDGLQKIFHLVRQWQDRLPEQALAMLADEETYLSTIDTVVSFLQGKTPEAAEQILRPGFLPQGFRFNGKTRFAKSVSLDDRAKHWGTLYLEDLADLVQATVSPSFALSRYAEHLAHSASSFDRLASALTEPLSVTDEFLLDALWPHLDRTKPTLVGLSVPFPGNLYGAFRVAQAIKQLQPNLPIVLGGGYANTELRRISDPRVFDYVDFITLDDGERPLLSLLEHLAGQRRHTELCRTFYRKDQRVLFADDRSSPNFSMGEVGCPTYRGLPLDRYLTILDSTNPMHRLWSEGHWNKLTVAHGCYWKQCTFCDVGLDYIGRYEATPTERLILQIEQLIAETGQRGFHFVDEAAPPAALKALALGVLERRIDITWWGNIRFEEAFSPDLCKLLAASGCIAVTAGLEAASDRLLDKMKKGITVDQTALVAAAFQEAGIMIHAYLMYGFPSETIQEAVDALERVRQLFKADLIQSAFWHRFTTTAHSPVGLDPKANGLRILGPAFEGFADNDLIHRDRIGKTPTWLGEGLRRSMLNFLEGRGLTLDVRQWFDYEVPAPNVPKNWVRTLLRKQATTDSLPLERRLVWLGNRPVLATHASHITLTLEGRFAKTVIRLPHKQGQWLHTILTQATPRKHKTTPYPWIRDIQASFPGAVEHFSTFLQHPAWKEARAAGLLLV